ncbi:MAG: TetR/AcrR family transcriptional regulator [Chloroflexi bacterium]|nr:TetR/AcrR family transcriptional regulator [Chloroflexota bacterium]
MITPRQRRHANTKQAILQTALALVAEKGLEKLSLREIARRVDYSPAGLYEYFDSKEDILRTLVDEGGQLLTTKLKSLPANLSPTEHLIQICLAYVKFALDNQAHFMLMNSFASIRRSLNEPIVPDSPYTISLQAVQTAVDAGDVQVQPAYGVEEITYSLWALIHGMAMLQLTTLQGFQADFPTINRQALETFIVGLGR